MARIGGGEEAEPHLSLPAACCLLPAACCERRDMMMGQEVASCKINWWLGWPAVVPRDDCALEPRFFFCCITLDKLRGAGHDGPVVVQFICIYVFGIN